MDVNKTTMNKLLSPSEVSIRDNYMQHRTEVLEMLADALFEWSDMLLAKFLTDAGWDP